ncbi:MAG: tryptophan synthase subunit beta [Desulfovibrio sp.]|uniref:tryptophan synthase subunit beta n=1 Tax=Desulfovibrio sp. TaxID=885 RepID=UPI00135DFF80|nr:tryptophan synthase subunit beta [Desulfovibrio sp.]MTJ93344.1 tryptophan synthase subunit beta [Desulfovibrio sp.]
MSQHSAPYGKPDSNGFFGAYGGQFVPEPLKARLDEVAEAMKAAEADPSFQKELDYLCSHYTGRPNPVFHCANLSRSLGGAQIWLKREDLNHLGAHKINNTLGQCLLAKRMGKKRVIAETGAGQHGVATAATAALMGLECTICMGEVDMERQHLNVIRMEMLGSRVVAAKTGQRTLKEAVDEALGMWIEDPEMFYVLGSAVGPHPYPYMVRVFQSVVGREARAQMLAETGRLPSACLGCVGGGSNAIGLFAGFLDDTDVRLLGVEPGGRGNSYGEHAASLCLGEPGVMHGFNSYMIKDPAGEAGEVYSISAGLDYPSVGPEHALLKDMGRAEYVSVTDREALDAFFSLSRHEGIIPALESSHALAHAIKMAPGMSTDDILLVNLSGRGDKDVAQVAEMMQKGLI